MNPSKPSPSSQRKTFQGTMRKIGLEGGIWALITNQGKSIELIDPPKEICKNGLSVEIEGDEHSADVTIGMMGSSSKVHSYRLK